MKTKFRNLSSLQQGTFESFKLEKTISYKNKLEHDFLYRLEFDLAVVTYSRFEGLLQTVDSTNPLTIFPAFFVLQRNGQQAVVLLESAKTSNCPKAQLVKSRIQIFCQNNSITFTVLTDIDVQTGELVNNLKLLYEDVNTRIAADDVFTVQKSFQNNDSITIAELKQRLSRESLINTFLFHNVLQADLATEIINDKTVVSPGLLFNQYIGAFQSMMFSNSAANN